MALAPPVARAEPTSYVDWPAILAGTLLAAALSFVLLTFGSAIGLSAVSAEPGEGAALLRIGVASGLWFLWVVVSAFAAGAYLTGRLRQRAADATADEVETRDGAHGVVVWAAAALLGALLAASGVAGVVGSVGAAAGTVVESAAEAVGGPLDTIAGRLVRGAAAGQEAEAARGEAAGLIAAGLRDGEVGAEDRAYLAELVATQTSLSPEEAAARVDAAVADAQALYDDAIAAAERARVATAIAAFVVAASLFVAAAASYFAAVAGGEHRDKGLAFRDFGRWA